MDKKTVTDFCYWWKKGISFGILTFDGIHLNGIENSLFPVITYFFFKEGCSGLVHALCCA